MKISRIGLTVAAAFAVGLVAAPAYAQTGPFQFFAITPCRVIDTRNANGPQGGPALVGLTARSFPLAGLCGVPTTARAAAVNVVAVAPTGGGNLRIYPAGIATPTVATLTFDNGEPAIANGAIVPLAAYNPTVVGDPTTNMSVAVFLAIQAGNPAHLVVDINGYFQ